MVRISQLDLKSDGGKRILNDYLDWERTNFKPWGKGVGGIDHYKTSSLFSVVSPSAFRSQAKSIAKVALQQLIATKKSRDSLLDGGFPITPELLQKAIESDPNMTEVEMQRARGTLTQGNDDASPPIHSVNHNSRMRSVSRGNLRQENASEDVQDSDDESYTASNDESSMDDSLQADDDASFRIGELQNSRAPFVTKYPSGDKLLAIFPLDGNVADADANQFEFIEDNTAIRRLGKVPDERKHSSALIGPGTDKLSFSDVDIMFVDAEIKKRLKTMRHQRDENGDIWEIRATLQLPFKCKPQFYSKDGRVLKNFRMRNNGRGFSWGYFWLFAWKPPKPKPAKRIGGVMVTVMSEEESSLYTERTYESKKRGKKSRKK